MTLSDSLNLFSEIYLQDIEWPNSLPERLEEAGFKEVGRKKSVVDEEGARMSRVLFQKPGAAFAISFLVSPRGEVSDGALVVPDQPDFQAQLLAFVEAQPNLVDTTEETRSYFAFAPEDVSWSLAASRFWTSKRLGQTGINFTLGPALLDFPDGTKCIALTASRNLALQDPMTDQVLADLTGQGSRLAKFVLIFSEIATKACPDLEQITWAAEAYGYKQNASSPGDMNGVTEDDHARGAHDPDHDKTSFILDGGYGENARSEDMTSAIYVNWESRFEFEFALSFKVDERLTAEMIQDALFDHLGIKDRATGDGTAPIEISGQTYTVRHFVESALFGNHFFLLQK